MKHKGETNFTATITLFITMVIVSQYFLNSRVGSRQEAQNGARLRGPRLVSPVAAAALAWPGLR